MKYFKTFEKYRYGVNGVGSLRNSLAALKRQNINGRYVDPEILAQGIRNEYEAITGEKYEDEVQMSMDNTIADIIGHFKLDGPDFMAAWDKVVKESVNEASDQQRLTHLRKFGIAPNNQPQNAAYIKQVSKPGKFFVDWKDAFKLGDVALEFIKSVGSISEFDIIDLKTMKRTGKQLDVKKGQLGNLRTTYGVRVNESVELDEAVKPYKKGQRVDYQLDHKGGVGKFADAMSKSKNIESGVIKKRTKGFAGTFKYELTNGLELYGSEIVGLTESSSKDGGDKSNGNSHHDDHQEKSIAQEWKDTYGEEFHSKYPAVAKIIKQRNIKDKRELSRIWQDTYGENFEEQYPALFNKLD